MNKESGQLVKRPPVVVVMGHVDHGKTTLLDFIRKSNVAIREAGGITQHIGAYEITHKGERITFLDTPGHEAFQAMRARGAKVSDIAILVVAADEGVKPQTKEALEAIKNAGLSFVVAINKIDKPGANPDLVKQDLAKIGVLVEGWGGKVPVSLVSAKSGEGIEDLLDTVLLVAELEELKADPLKAAEGTIIEAHLDQRRGPAATALILDGTLRRGDAILAGKVVGKAKILENFLGEPIAAATFSSPVRIIGWEELPQVGDKFYSGPPELLVMVTEAVKSAEIAIENHRRPQPQGEDALTIILKADTIGSLEALETIVRKFEKEVPILIKDRSVGDISEGDIKLADATGAFIVAFGVKISREAASALKQKTVPILTGDIIYELEDLLRKKIEELKQAAKEPKAAGKLEILAIFREDGKRQIVGGKVIEGKLEKGMKVKILRKGEAIGEGKIINLQSRKQDVPEVEAGKECGLLISSDIKIAKGDIIEGVGSMA